MSTTLAVLFSLILAAASALLHFECLKLLNGLLPRVRIIERRAKVLAGFAGAMISHWLQIMLFALAYYVLRDRFGLGGFGGHFHDVFTNFVYFSAETYSSLGLGDIFPMGSLRLVTGIETLTGLLMISWTASFTYLEMQRYWR